VPEVRHGHWSCVRGHEEAGRAFGVRQMEILIRYAKKEEKFAEKVARDIPYPVEMFCTDKPEILKRRKGK